MSKELTPLEALWKIDHTICMNFNDKNIKWNIDKPEDYPEGGYDEKDTDCKSFDDFCDCYDIIETVLKEYEKPKKIVGSISFEQSMENYVKNNCPSIAKKLKALDIILKKGNFISLEYNEFNNKYYIYDNELYMHNEITKEEYDLLKEVGLS